jgi:hypothetical protein
MPTGILYACASDPDSATTESADSLPPSIWLVYCHLTDVAGWAGMTHCSDQERLPDAHRVCPGLFLGLVECFGHRLRQHS